MAKKKYPSTQAVRFLKDKGIDFIPHQFRYEEKGGTRQCASELNVDEHNIIKTLVFETDSNEPFLMLMHGDMEVSEKELSRHIGVKSIKPASQKDAMKYTGYQFGGTSPFGTKKDLRTYAEISIFDLEQIYINCGKPGFLVEIKSSDLEKALGIEKVNVGIKK